MVISSTLWFKYITDWLKFECTDGKFDQCTRFFMLGGQLIATMKDFQDPRHF